MLLLNFDNECLLHLFQSYEMDPGYEELKLKTDEIEDCFASLKEFTFGQLHVFGKRLNEFEGKHNITDKEVRVELETLSRRCTDMESRQSSDVSGLREELDKLSNRYTQRSTSSSMSLGYSDVTVPVASSTPLPSAPRKSQAAGTTPVASSTPLPSAPRKPQAAGTSDKQSVIRNPLAVSIPRPPEELDDVANHDLREALKTYIPKTFDAREKLNKVQVAYVSRWMAICDEVKGNHLIAYNVICL